jgi:hypothetical protein
MLVTPSRNREDNGMRKHEPPNYRCPFCSLVGGGETDRNRQADIVARNELTTA